MRRLHPRCMSPAVLVNKETGEIKEQEVFIGELAIDD